MNRLALDRRRFLKLVGATAFSYPFLRGLPSYAAGGATPASPYLVLLFSGCGTVRPNWGATGAAPTGTTAVTTSPLVFRETLSAFTKAGPMGADLTSQITVLDGLSAKAAQGSHEAGMAALWTGQTNSGGSPATSPSIDQAIVPLMKSQLGISPSNPSIQLIAQSKADYPQRQIDTRMLYDTTGNWVDPYTSPSAALGTLFQAALAPPTMTGPDKATFIRQKVAAQVNSDLTAIQGRLCNQDRAQLQALQSLYNQVLAQLAAGAAAAASCSVPNIGDAGSSSSSQGSTGPDPFPQYVSAMSNILAMALACDLTRVSSLQLSHALSPVTHTWIDSVKNAPTSQGGPQTHHQYSHMGPSSMYSLGPDIYNEPAGIVSSYPQQLIDIDTWYATQIASFAYTLSQLKSGISSGSLLDQTVVCWGSELDMGAAHNHDDTPFVLLGGGAGKVKTNQLVRFPLGTGNSAGQAVPGNRAHNDLLLTLAQIMGVSLPGGTFGTASYCTGVIKEILV